MRTITDVDKLLGLRPSLDTRGQIECLEEVVEKLRVTTIVLITLLENSSRLSESEYMFLGRIKNNYFNLKDLQIFLDSDLYSGDFNE